ncbi:hypothetical protein MFIFM68171_05466 [Madurella fahalii]|uniref:Uncharacterized protein n=1 Tax=Madurella fahalii TaxID=1157608 RepID=A0ABQ0GBV8_9PEZI
MDSATTIFRPDPTCFASSNLWLDIRPGGYGCNTYYPPFSPQPTEIVTPLSCPYPRLGPKTFSNTNRDDHLCYQYNGFTTGGTAYSDCPEGMTAAATVTTPWLDDIIIVGTTCCPTAYDFAAPGNTIPTPIPSVIGSSTYPVILSTVNMCKATSIKDFSDQTVTLTVSTSPTLSTTEVAWDYDIGFIVAEPAGVYKYLYPDRDAGTTSTCFGHLCPDDANPFKARPTPAPTGTYIPPPSAAVTQFTPSPSCLSESNFWLVSASCYLDNEPRSPPWLQCTYTLAGDPDVSHTACYPEVYGRPTVVSGTPFHYSACPAGYTVAHSHFYKPFDLPSYASSKTQTFEVEASAYTCCPSAFGDIDFTYTMLHPTSKTVHGGATHTVNVYPLPWCVASRVSQLGGVTVTMSLYSDARVWDRKRQGHRYGTTEAMWDVAGDTLFAHGPQLSWTVFHGTHTCFESCDDYFRYSYHNTDPNYVPPTTTMSTVDPRQTHVEGSGGGALQIGTGSLNSTSSSSAGAAAAIVGGDRKVGLSAVVVVVVVTVVRVAVGEFV